MSDRLPASGIAISTCGEITIEKEIVGDGSVDFTFDPSEGINDGDTFDLDDDADGTLDNSETFVAVPDVTHTIEETAAAAPRTSTTTPPPSCAREPANGQRTSPTAPSTSTSTSASRSPASTPTPGKPAA